MPNQATLFKEKNFRYIKDHIANDQVTNLLADNCFRSYADFYNYYPEMFSLAFPTVDKKTVQILNIAGFLSYKAVVLNDEFVDTINPGKIELEKKEASTILAKEAVKLLSTIFSKESPFWIFWNKRKDELAATTVLDKSFRERKFSYKLYTDFADNKSAFAKLAIDSLHVFSEMKFSETHEMLLKSHKEFSVAMQLFDDLFDVEEDLINNQFNIALYYLEKFLLSQDIQIRELNTTQLEKHLFLSDVSDTIIRKAITHLNKASEYAAEYNLPEWQKAISFYLTIYHGVINNKLGYVSIVNARAKNSFTKNVLRRNDSSFKQQIETAISAGREFVENRQQVNGAWFEYITSAGVSDVWATGFVGFFGKNILSAKALYKARKLLNQSNQPLWGYKQGYIADTDSSNFALQLLRSNNKEAFQMLVARQNKDGGFPTYTAAEIYKLRSAMGYSREKKYSGWTQSHACVSAVSYHLFLTNKQHVPESAIHGLEQFLTTSLEHNQHLSYWWTSDTYALYWLALSLPFVQNSHLRGLIKKRINTFEDMLTGKEYADDNFGQPSAFYTAMAARIFLMNGRTGHHRENQLPLKFINWIVNNQFSDGSWLPTNAMRLPDTDILIPDTSSSWPASERGCNIRAIEFNRLFTTSVTINTLDYFRRNKIL